MGEAFSIAFHVLARVFFWGCGVLLPSVKKAFLGVVYIICFCINERREPLEFKTAECQLMQGNFKAIA